eukprot:9942633-Lingulodinium_polyedra.AAC.1
MEETAKAWVPPGATICKDRVNSRWLVKFGPHGTKSRSFALYGERGSLVAVLAWSWAKHQLDGGSACLFDWVGAAAEA